MDITFTATKDEANIAKHGVSLAAAEGMDWNAALVRADVRFDYPEPRMVAMAPIGDRLYVLVFTVERRSLRVISLRKANRKEFDRYADEA